MLERTVDNGQALQNNAAYLEKVSFKTSLAYFLIFCGWPFCFYFSYVYCTTILKNQFHYTSAELINHNFLVSIFSWFIHIYSTYRKNTSCIFIKIEVNNLYSISLSSSFFTNKSRIAFNNFNYSNNWGCFWTFYNTCKSYIFNALSNF